MNNDANWYILQTTPMYEKSVMHRIESLIESGNYPDLLQCKMLTQIVQKESRNRSGETVIKDVEEKLFPCYLFIKMIYNPDVITAIRLLTGVLRWVGIGYEPIPLTPSELLNYPDLCEVDMSLFNPGDNVRVSHGPLEGFVGTFKEFNEDTKQVFIECELFGRSSTISVEANQIEKL